MAAGPHQWSTTALDNQTADPRAKFPVGMPAAALDDACRALMQSGALSRDDHLGTLVATLGANNVYSVTTNEGLIDPLSIVGGGTAKISKPFLIRVVLPALNTPVASARPTLIVDGAAAVPIKKRDGSDLADGDLTVAPVEILGDTVTAGAYGRARILDTLVSDMPQVNVAAIYAQIESRAAAYADDRKNNSVTGGRWVLVGAKSVFDQPGTGGFISPFGGHTMHCDYWSYQFLDANGIVQCAPFAFRFRAFQVYIAAQGWVTCGAAS
jgi:hypothetical protein